MNPVDDTKINLNPIDISNTKKSNKVNREILGKRKH